ncbi:hypothetical protein Tco_1066364 [Tanacetum coccineum]|uniref:Reverse transcriptase Ty1/copia-type domain-containing protein n=1 Tax=Tanacetum coccineum TaxID=301880 RepID=A0ABQ5H9V1_9ASTR
MDKRSPINQVRGNHPSRAKKNTTTIATILKCEELHQFDTLPVWELVDKLLARTYSSESVWKNKKDEDQIVIRNKARLVAKGYAQEEDRREDGIFLNCPFEGDGLCGCNQKDFVDLAHPDKVLPSKAALYGLNTSPESWTSDPPMPHAVFLSIRAIYTFEFIKKLGMDKRTKHWLHQWLRKPKLDADLMWVTVDPTDHPRPTEKHLKEVKRIFRYLRGTIHMGLWYPKGSGFELTAFSDADHAGCVDTRKSTSGGIQFLGDKLVSWMSKKQNCTAMSSAEAEYVALSASCAQEQVENGIIELYFVRTEYQLADMFTKALPEDRFQYLVRQIGMRCLTPAELEGRMPTKIELTLEQSQQGVSNDVLLLTRVLRIILVILPEHPSDTYVLTIEDGYLLEPASKQALGNENKQYGNQYICVRRSYALSWKPCQGDSLNLPDHRIHKDGDGDASFQLESNSLPHAHAQTTKTCYKHQDSRIMKAQELKTKTSAQTLIYKIFLQRYQVYQGRLLASFQDDAKYEHVGQDIRSQGGKDDQDKRIKI